MTPNCIRSFSIRDLAVGAFMGGVIATGSVWAANPSESTQLTAIEARLEALERNPVVDLGHHMKLEKKSADGLAGPRILISGANLQLINGAGSTKSNNGLGNLVIGYNEPARQGNVRRDRRGSHNLIIGPEHKYNAIGGLVAGNRNTVKGTSSSVIGGIDNTASGAYASVAGGSRNLASGDLGAVAAGCDNTASGRYASVNGGEHNVASGIRATVSGGFSNKATGESTSVTGGFENVASANFSSVVGGRGNSTDSDFDTKWAVTEKSPAPDIPSPNKGYPY